MSDSKFSWSFSLKDIIYILVIGVICFFGYRAYKDLSTQVQQSNVAFKQLSETLARAQNELVTKAELEAFAKQSDINLLAIKKDLDSLGAHITAVGQTVASIEGKIEANQGSDGSTTHEPPDQPTDCKLCDIHGYTAAIQKKDIKIGEMPYSEVQFDASKSKPWTIATDDIDVNVTTVQGKSDKEDVDLFYHEISLTNKSRPDLLDKKFKLKITSSEFKQTLSRTKSWYWWAPHLDINLDNSLMPGLNTDYYRFGGSAGISIFAYGLTKDDNDWRFLHVGAGINSQENAYLTLTPVKYNIGKFLPLISDLWLSVGAVWDTNWGINIGLGTTL